MTRFLVGLCGVTVALGAIVRLSMTSESSAPAPAAKRPAAAVAVPAPAADLPSQDGSFLPPSPGASAEEHAEYQRALEAAQAGKGPVQARTAPISHEELEKRQEARRKAVEARRQQQREEREKIRAHMEKARELADPNWRNRPAPAPLLPPPVLGPAAVEAPQQ